LIFRRNRALREERGCDHDYGAVSLIWACLGSGNRESCVADDGSARRVVGWLLYPIRAVGGVEAAKFYSRPHRDLRVAGAGVLIKC
jgi:hypothetical protein